MLGKLCFWILLAAYAFPCNVLSAQNHAYQQYAFSGTVTEAQCHELPSISFDIGPSLGRSGTGDHLTVRCVPMNGHASELSLTFAIEAPVTSDVNRYSFRWGKAVGNNSVKLQGQFTRDPKLCTKLADLFNSTISKTNVTTSEQLRRSPEWTVGCYGDDHWGTSMEISLIRVYRESP